MTWWLLVVIMCALPLAQAQGSWTHPTGSPSISWTINASNVIEFTYYCKTRGWMAMGLSPDGMMVGSDIFWGQYDSIGPVIVDRKAFGYFKPPPDAVQDLTLMPAKCSFTSTETTLVFSRKLNTGDTNDRPIVAGLMFLVYSYSLINATRPPNATADFDFIQHNFQGSAQVDFLTPTTTTTAAAISTASTAAVTSNAVTTSNSATSTTNAAATTRAVLTNAAAAAAVVSTSAASTAASTSFTSTTATSTTAQATSLAAVTDSTGRASLSATTTSAGTTFASTTIAASSSAASTTGVASTSVASTNVASTFNVITSEAATSASATTTVLGTSLASTQAAATTTNAASITTTAAVVTATTGTTARPTTATTGTPAVTATTTAGPTPSAPIGGSGKVDSSDRIISVAWKITDDTVRFTVTSGATGWTGVGLSRSGGMLNADIFWMQIDENGNAVVQDRYTTTSHSMPLLDPVQNLVLVAGSKSGAVSTFVFERPVAATDPNDVSILATDQVMIWAWGASLGTPVTKRQAATEYTFSKHQSKPRCLNFAYGAQGALSVNFVSGASSGKVNDNTMFKLHGVLMILAWAFFSVFGTFIARYNKAGMGRLWFYLHVIFQCLAVLINLIAFIVIVMQRNKLKDSHFDGPHQVIGLVVLIFSLVQPILGLVSHLLFDSSRAAPPFFPDKVHWLVGGFILFFTLGQLYLGISIWCISPMGIAAYGIFIFVATALFLSFDLMRWLAPWGEYLRAHDKDVSAPKLALWIAQAVGALIMFIALIIVMYQIWSKNPDTNTKSFYRSCDVGNLDGGYVWAWYLGFGGAFVLGCATVAAVAWCITSGLDRKYHTQSDNPYIITL